jgi:hypothetical protein
MTEFFKRFYAMQDETYHHLCNTHHEPLPKKKKEAMFYFYIIYVFTFSPFSTDIEYEGTARASWLASLIL